MKKIIVFFLTFLSIIGIYYGLNSKKINYVSLTDSIMNNSFSYYNYNNYLEDYLLKKDLVSSFNTNFTSKRISLMLNDIKSNRTIKVDKEYYLKKVLRESDCVIISMGMEELSNNYSKYDMKNNYSYFNKMYLDIEKLIIELKKYAQGHIIFIGYYNPTNYYDGKVDEFFFFLDTKLNRLMMNNKITYIDIYELVKGNNYKNNIDPTLLNNFAHKKISEIIKFYLD